MRPAASEDETSGPRLRGLPPSFPGWLH